MRKQLVGYTIVALASAVLTTIFQPWAHLPASARADTQFLAQTGNCQDFKETGKRACGRFLEYWQQNGGLAQQGYPISNEFTERSELDGKEYRVQYFERAVFEMHPENKAPYDVLLSQLGTFRFREKYPNGEPGQPPAPTVAPAPPPGVQVTVPIPPVEGLTASIYMSPKFAKCSDQNDMEWGINIANRGKIPANVRIDKASASMIDNTGKVYRLPREESCQTADHSAGAFAQALKPEGISLNPGQEFWGSIRVAADEVPANVTYFDFRITVNGAPLVFRYSVK